MLMTTLACHMCGHPAESICEACGKAVCLRHSIPDDENPIRFCGDCYLSPANDRFAAHLEELREAVATIGSAFEEVARALRKATRPRPPRAPRMHDHTWSQREIKARLRRHASAARRRR